MHAHPPICISPRNSFPRRSLSLLPFLSHEVIFLHHMQQSALTLFTDATAEGSAV
jgi:hypothetical protein